MTSSDQAGVRVPESDAEVEGYKALVREAFNSTQEHADLWAEQAGREHMRVVVRDGRVVAGMVYYPMGQFFGGESVPTWGIAGVVVAPHVRSDGVGSAMMSECLAEMHAAGVALSALYPATQPIYRRLGWELAGMRTFYEFDPAQVRKRETGLRTRPIEESDRTAVRALQRASARATAGNLDRPDPIWWKVTTDHRATPRAYLVERDGVVEGYVYFEQEGVGLGGTLHVRDWSWTTRAAGEELLQLFANHRSLVRTVKFWGAPADAVAVLLGEQGLRQEERFDWMLRLVRVRAALEARGYPAHVSGALELEIRDDRLPSNDGPITLELEGGRARVEPGGKGAYKLDVRGLAALYSGLRTPAELRSLGYLEGSAEDGLLAAAFAGPTPWMPEFF